MQFRRWRIVGLIISTLALGGGCGLEDGSRVDGTQGRVKSVPRNRTLIMDCSENNTCAGQIIDYDSFNPFIPGAISRTGYNFMYEPLFFFNAYEPDSEVIPWIGESFQFNADYTEIIVKVRPGVEWSDGMPWTAHDFVFTINMLKAHVPQLSYSTDMETWVETAVAVDSLTARIKLKASNPRFLSSYFIHSGDQGVVILPEHIWRDKDPLTFSNFDKALGWPVTTGPYYLSLSEPSQRIWDIRPDWWAAKIGFQVLPQVERVIFLPYMEEVKRVQNLIANNIDTSLELRPSNIISVLKKNPNVSTWTGREPPYSYITWWPISLGFNNLEAPFNDKEIRWAINYAIDRRQLVEIGWQNSGDWTLLPLPDVPQMKPYMEAGESLARAMGVDQFDLLQSAQIMQRKGWERGTDGFWQKDGEVFSFVIDIIPHFQDLVPIVVEQLKKAGFDVGFRMTSDTVSRIIQGKALAFMWGNFSSMRDPYFVMRSYHSRFVVPTGQSAEQHWRWENDEYDALIDQMGRTAPEDTAMLGIYTKAMQVWLDELPSVPLVQWPHRIAHNETYWTNWPSAKQPYINSAYWSRTWLLVLLNLKPVQG